MIQHQEIQQEIICNSLATIDNQISQPLRSGLKMVINEIPKVQKNEKKPWQRNVVFLNLHSKIAPSVFWPYG